jgi:hypothetical protein
MNGLSKDQDAAACPGDAPGLEAFNALLRRTLAMPAKPHSEMKLGKPRGRRKAVKDTAERGTSG